MTWLYLIVTVAAVRVTIAWQLARRLRRHFHFAAADLIDPLGRREQ